MRAIIIYRMSACTISHVERLNYPIRIDFRICLLRIGLADTDRAMPLFFNINSAPIFEPPPVVVLRVECHDKNSLIYCGTFEDFNMVARDPNRPITRQAFEDSLSWKKVENADTSSRVSASAPVMNDDCALSSRAKNSGRRRTTKCSG